MAAGVVDAEAAWSDEEILARAHDLMPDVPVLPGIADVDQAPGVVEAFTAAVESFVAAAVADGTITAMLGQARALLGTTEHPPGSNHAPPVTPWYGFDGSWCDMAVSYEAAHSGCAGFVGKFAYCPAHTRYFANRGQWKYGGDDLQPGDIVFYNWSRGATLNADHVGVVEHVLSDGTFYALEGNTSDVFARRHRDRTYVAGRGRPAYHSAPTGGGGGGGGGGAHKPRWSGRYLRYAHGHTLMHGQDVTWVQRLLAHHGHHVAADGWYGGVTAGAVLAFQREQHLAADGVVGPKTWEAL